MTSKSFGDCLKEANIGSIQGTSEAILKDDKILENYIDKRLMVAMTDIQELKTAGIMAGLYSNHNSIRGNVEDIMLISILNTRVPTPSMLEGDYLFPFKIMKKNVDNLEESEKLAIQAEDMKEIENWKFDEEAFEANYPNQPYKPITENQGAGREIKTAILNVKDEVKSSKQKWKTVLNTISELIVACEDNGQLTDPHNKALKNRLISFIGSLGLSMSQMLFKGALLTQQATVNLFKDTSSKIYRCSMLFKGAAPAPVTESFTHLDPYLSGGSSQMKELVVYGYLSLCIANESATSPLGRNIESVRAIINASLLARANAHAMPVYRQIIELKKMIKKPMIQMVTEFYFGRHARGLSDLVQDLDQLMTPHEISKQIKAMKTKFGSDKSRWDIQKMDLTLKDPWLWHMARVVNSTVMGRFRADWDQSLYSFLISVATLLDKNSQAKEGIHYTSINKTILAISQVSAELYVEHCVVMKNFTTPADAPKEAVTKLNEMSTLLNARMSEITKAPERFLEKKDKPSPTVPSFDITDVDPRQSTSQGTNLKSSRNDASIESSMPSIQKTVVIQKSVIQEPTPSIEKDSDDNESVHDGESDTDIDLAGN